MIAKTGFTYHSRFASLTGFLAMLSLLAVVVIPVWSTQIAPLHDYHNHVARQYILANLPHSDFLKIYYEADWHATPYLAMDAIVQTLARFFSVEVSCKIFLSLTLLLLGIAPFALNLALLGRVTPIALLGMLFIHSFVLTVGFMPYLFSVGFAVCLLSSWIWLRERRPWIRLVVFPILSSLLFFSHLVGFVIYALTSCAYELGNHLKRIQGHNAQFLFFFDHSQRINLASFLLQFCMPLVIFSLYGPSSEIEKAIHETSYGGIWRKASMFLGMFHYLITPYSWSLDNILAVVLPLGLLLLLATRALELSRQMWLPLLAMLVLFFAMPMQWLGGWGGTIDYYLL